LTLAWTFPGKTGPNLFFSDLRELNQGQVWSLFGWTAGVLQWAVSHQTCNAVRTNSRFNASAWMASGWAGIPSPRRSGGSFSAMFLRASRGNPYHPVERVSWHDVQEFMSRLNKRHPDTTFRLPTEAEWKYACRYGGLSETYAGSMTPQNVGWYQGNSGGTTHSVGKCMPNGLELFDMRGGPADRGLICSIIGRIDPVKTF
jgi:formylglycine-generating enzyme required for sulfatase activity